MTVPLLDKGYNGERLQKVVAGNRALAVDWIAPESGKPFSIEIWQNGQALCSETSDETNTTLPAVTLVPGKARIAILSGSDLSEFDIEVVEALPDSARIDALKQLDSRPFARFLAAGTLAGEERGTWRFEAYQQLQGLGGFKPAARLADQIARGERL